MSRHRSARGAATAELALALPLLLAVTTALVWLLALGVAQVRTVDAAREAARALARGDPTASALAAGQRVAPPGVRLTVHRDGRFVVVRASGEVRGPGGLFAHLPAVALAAEAAAVREDAVEVPP